jgi:hypothetical protein
MVGGVCRLLESALGRVAACLFKMGVGRLVISVRWWLKLLLTVLPHGVSDHANVFVQRFDTVRNGLLRFDSGASRAQTANGTFNFKRQWCTQVVPVRDVHTEWIFYGEELSLRLRCHLNRQGFISEDEGLHCRVVLLGSEEGLTEAGLAQERKGATRCGLDGILLVSSRTNGAELSYQCSS